MTRISLLRQILGEAFVKKNGKVEKNGEKNGKNELWFSRREQD